MARHRNPCNGARLIPHSSLLSERRERESGLCSAKHTRWTCFPWRTCKDARILRLRGGGRLDAADAAPFCRDLPAQRPAAVAVLCYGALWFAAALWYGRDASCWVGHGTAVMACWCRCGPVAGGWGRHGRTAHASRPRAVARNSWLVCAAFAFDQISTQPSPLRSRPRARGLR